MVDLVKESGVSVTFHVLDADSYQKAKADGVDLSDPQPRPAQNQNQSQSQSQSQSQNQNQSQPAMNGVAGQTPKPKLCYLVKTSVGFGFSLLSAKSKEEGRKGDGEERGWGMTGGGEKRRREGESMGADFIVP